MYKSIKKMNALLLMMMFSLLVVSCGERQAAEGDLTGEVKVDGSSTVYPISEAVAEEYRTEQPSVQVTIGVSGTGGGFKKFLRGETDINNASRTISESELQTAQEQNIEFIELPIAYDGLAVVVHPDNNWVDYLTVEELKKIWEPEAQGKIKTWNQIRPEWPNEEIHLYGPGVESGTYDYFTEAVVGKSHSSRGDFTASEDDNVLVQGVSGDKLALGFFGLAYFEENADKLKIVPIEDNDPSNGSGPVVPSKETVMNSTYQPLSRPVFIYVKTSSLENEAVVDFVNFYLSNVKDLVTSVGYIPLSDKSYELVQQRFENRTHGTAFKGKMVGVNIENVLSGNEQPAAPATDNTPSDTSIVQ